MAKTIHYSSKRHRYGRNLLLGLFVLASTLSFKTNHQEIHILFTGDILLSRNVKQEIQFEKASPWEGLKTLLHSADLVAGNLEGAIGQGKDQMQSISGSPVFDIDTADISLLADAGFNIITTENNHSLDFGIRGKAETIKALRNNNITPVQFDNSPQFFTVKGIVVALLVLNIIPGQDHSKNEIPSIALRQKLRMSCNLANIVIVSIHWGSELLEWPNKEQREAAKWLIENGADVIIGSHPHVIQEPEIIEGKPVFFSLGNHLFDQKYPATKEGLIVDIQICNGEFLCNGILTHTRTNSFYPEIIGKNDYQFNPIAFRNNSLEINGYAIKPISISDSNQNKIILEAFKSDRKIWSKHPLSLVDLSTNKFDGEIEYLFTLEKHYSNMDGEISIRPYVYTVDNAGLIAKWRGSALAWPLLDAIISPTDNNILCALHRGDSFINLDSTSNKKRVAAYKWNGFGFTGIDDSTTCESCRKLFGE
jgi:poly-gamma-glutamate synthesis protein (capsule biosynthesis protein)